MTNQNNSLAKNIKVVGKKDKDSLKKRYFFKLLTNFIGIPLGIVAQAIIPRGLGPKAYGDFHFLSNFFGQGIGFLDSGTSIGFYTKLSQRQKEKGLVSFYFYFMLVVALAVIAFVIVSHLTMIYRYFWPGQLIFYVYLAAVWAIFDRMIQALEKVSDAYGLTVPAEKTKILQKILGLVLITGLYLFGKLNLANFFYYYYFILFFLAVALIWIMEKKGFSLRGIWRLSGKQLKKYIREFYRYVRPLFIYSLVGVIAIIFDRWLLQVYGGSVQQGFFGLSYKIGAVSFIFGRTMTPLITREFSIVFRKRDLSQMALLFRRYVPLLYSVVAFFACFIALQADRIIYIIGGAEFKEAFLVVFVMAFYPVQQVYGQLSGAIFYTTGRTKLYSNIGMIFLLFGLPFSYFLIAPLDKMGLNMGAVGLAVKMVLLAFIIANVQFFFNAKFLKLSFWKYIIHQILTIGFFLAIAAFSRLLIEKIAGFAENIILNFVLAGILYIIIVFVFIYFIPIIFGIKKEDIKYLLRLLKYGLFEREIK